MLDELKIKQRILQLQEARSMGLTKLADITAYEKEKANRLANKAIGYNPYQFEKPIARIGGHRAKDDVSPRSTPGPSSRRIPLDITHSQMVDLLSTAEKDLCTSLRIYPKPYLIIKDKVLREYTCKGSLTLAQAHALLDTIHPTKATRLFEFFLENGWIKASFP